jgi:hypothetical protein
MKSARSLAKAAWGKCISMSRGTRTTELVLITNFRQEALGA